VGDIVGYGTGGSFKRSMFTYDWYGLLVARVPLLWGFVRSEHLVLLPVMAFGIWRGMRSRPAQRDMTIYLLSLATCTALFVMNYDVPDVIDFCIPLFMALAVFLGIGLDAAVESARRRWPDDPRVVRCMAVGLVGLVTAVAGVDYSGSSHRGDRADARRVERLIRVAGSGAVLLTDDYQDSEYVWYYLLGEGDAAQHDLALANQVRPGQVDEYLERRTGPVEHAASQTGRSDPPLYTATPHQALTLAARGLTLTEVAPSVWRVGERPHRDETNRRSRRASV
jgi:hypothetical protein